MTKTCENCRFWSEMVAQVQDSKVQAICLEPTSNQDFTSESHTCDKWKSNTVGAVDSPSNKAEEAYKKCKHGLETHQCSECADNDAYMNSCHTASVELVHTLEKYGMEIAISALASTCAAFISTNKKPKEAFYEIIECVLEMMDKTEKPTLTPFRISHMLTDMKTLFDPEFLEATKPINQGSATLLIKYGSYKTIATLAGITASIMDTAGVLRHEFIKQLDISIDAIETHKQKKET